MEGLVERGPLANMSSWDFPVEQALCEYLQCSSINRKPSSEIQYSSKSHSTDKSNSRTFPVTKPAREFEFL